MHARKRSTSWSRSWSVCGPCPGSSRRRGGVFYVRSKPFLHFHEDPSGLHADVRLGPEFTRVRVETAEERDTLLAGIEAAQARP